MPRRKQNNELASRRCVGSPINLMKKNYPLSRFDRIVSRYFPFVYGCAAKINGDPLFAMPLTQRVFRSNRARLTHLRRPRDIKAALTVALYCHLIQTLPV